MNALVLGLARLGKAIRCAAACSKAVFWMKSYERIAKEASQLPGTRHVCIGDRELDLVALMVMAR